MTQQWACSKCGKLLGVIANGKVRIQIGKIQYTAGGTGMTVVEAVCPKCFRLNEVAVPPFSESVPKTIQIS